MTSGPSQSTPVTSGSITTGANSQTVTSPACNTGAVAGLLITVALTGTPSATQTVTCKLYQGSTSGTQVAPTAGLLGTFTGTTEDTRLFQFVDTSAAAQNASGLVYVAGFATNTGTNTIAYAFIAVETLGPVS